LIRFFAPALIKAKNTARQIMLNSSLGLGLKHFHRSDGTRRWRVASRRALKRFEEIPKRNFFKSFSLAAGGAFNAFKGKLLLSI